MTKIINIWLVDARLINLNPGGDDATIEQLLKNRVFCWRMMVRTRKHH